MNLEIIVCVLIAYLLGSIPTAIWYGKWVHQIDVREHGSGNAGTANALRVLGKRAGAVVLVIDVLKGALAVFLVSYLLNNSMMHADNTIFFQLIFGITAILGHLFPVFAQFKGGKGVATFLGMMLVIHWKISLICILIFIVVLWLWSYTSLASMVAACALPLLLALKVFGETDPILFYFSLICAGLIVFMHRQNIQRLVEGVESKTKW